MTENQKLADALAPERIIFPEGTTKQEVLEELIGYLQEVPGIESREELAQAIFGREELMSTGIGIGLAIPHCRLGGVKTITAAVAVCPEAVGDYVALDNQPVKIVVMIVAGRHQQTGYIQALSQLSSVLKEETIRNRILSSGDAEEIHRILAGMEEAK